MYVVGQSTRGGTCVVPVTVADGWGCNYDAATALDVVMAFPVPLPVYVHLSFGKRS